MNLSTLDVAAVLGAIFAGVVSVLGAWRALSGDKFQRSVDQGAAVLRSYTGLVDSLEERVATMQAEHSREIEAIRQRHTADRAEWELERAHLRTELDASRADRARLHTDLNELRALLNETILNANTHSGSASGQKGHTK